MVQFCALLKQKSQEKTDEFPVKSYYSNLVLIISLLKNRWLNFALSDLKSQTNNTNVRIPG